jgi:uncharacterized protein YqiB (DUF1249 family)
LQITPSFHRQQKWLKYKPSISELMQVGEENYRLIQQLVPNLKTCSNCIQLLKEHPVPLELDILEQTKYTTLFLLTHRINSTSRVPNATLRAYHDARQLELIDLKSQVYNVSYAYEAPALEDKIKANRFINRWLHYCKDIQHN